jgi:hypothetical protein
MRPTREIECAMTVKVAFEPNTIHCNCVKTSCPATTKECDKIYDKRKIAALVSALKELGVTVHQWMPIDSAPKDGTVVLGFWMSTEDIHQIMPICYDDYTGWYAVDFFSSSDGGPKVYPTHWMPLPTNNGECDISGKPCDAVEDRPVVRGKWIQSMLYSVPTRACSVCGMIMPDFWKGPYCECGALMEASDGK